MSPRPLLALLIASLSAGCAMTPDTPPVAVEGMPAPAYERQLAEDAGLQLQALLPPASTRLTVHATRSAGLGAALAGTLRGAGYAVEESTPVPQGIEESADHTGSSTAPDPGAKPGVPVQINLGQLHPANLYYVTVKAGHHRLSRAYLAQQGLLRPAGAWVIGEQR